MFSRRVAPGIEIRLFEPKDADAIFFVVERNRAYLREWLPWVDFTTSPEDLRRFIVRVREQFASGRGPQFVWEPAKRAAEKNTKYRASGAHI